MQAPLSLISDLAFDVLYTIEECVYLEICDILCDHEMHVDHINNGDMNVYIYFEDNWANGCLIIDRCRKEYILEFRVDDEYCAPIIGTLEEVLATYIGLRNE
jgi:hypothetical protein